MDLKTFIEKKWINVSAFARDVGVSTQYIYRVMNGEKKVSLKVAKKIYTLTDGEVDFYDIGKYPDHDESEKNQEKKEIKTKENKEDTIYIPVSPEEAHLISAMQEITSSLTKRLVKHKKIMTSIKS